LPSTKAFSLGIFLALERTTAFLSLKPNIKKYIPDKKYLFNVKTRKLTYHPKTIQNIFQINFEKLEIIPI
jgi:hypothetical protein